MDELKDEISALKVSMKEFADVNATLNVSMKELVDVNATLKNEVQALTSQVSALSLTNRETAVGQQGQQKQQAVEFRAFTETMPDKYSDVRFLTMDERKEIKFKMGSNLMSCLRPDNGEPSRFYDFTRDGEEDVRKPEEDNGLTGISLGTFLTPVAGRYRFDVRGSMDNGGKADWYICFVPKEFDNIHGPRDSDDDDDNDSSSSSDDENDDDDEVEEEDEGVKQKKKEKKERKAEKDRIFKEKSKRHLLFTFDPEKCAAGKGRGGGDSFNEGSVGIDCDKGLRFWIEVMVTEGRFSQRCCVCVFEGRLVC